MALVFCKDLDIKQSTVYKFSLMECTDFSVKLPGLSINLAVIYRPPERSMLQFTMDMLEYMEMNVNTTGNIILTGDFNIKMNNPDDPDMNTLSDLFDSFDLVNHVRFPTHRSMNTLDLVITSGDTNFMRNPSQGRLFLDHNIVHFQVVTTKQPSEFKVSKYRKLKDIVRENFQKDISKLVDQLDLENRGPADCLHAYNNVMQRVLDKHALIKTKKISSNKKRVPWFNSEISTAIRDHRRAECKWYKNTNDPNLFMDFYCARRAVSHLIDTAKKGYYHDMLLENRHNSKEVLHIYDSLLGRNQESPMPPGFPDSQLAENFNNFFITKIAKIKTLLHEKIANMPLHPQFDTVSQLPPKLEKFRVLTDDEVAMIIGKSPSKCCNQIWWTQVY